MVAPSVELLDEDLEEIIYVRRQLLKRGLALVSLVVLACLCAIATFGKFLAPYDPQRRDAKSAFVLPQQIRFRDENGLHWPPFVYGVNSRKDPETLWPSYVVDPESTFAIRLFVHGDPYKMWGLVETDVHLIGTTEQAGPMYLLGTDRLGRDVLSRLIAGGRTSLSIGLVSALSGLVLGIALDDTPSAPVQWILGFVHRIPKIPMCMALSAALPLYWPPARVYVGLAIILSLAGWTRHARLMGARSAGGTRILFWALSPRPARNRVAALILSVPSVVLAETALSFLGLGLRPPTISWGVLLQAAQSVRVAVMEPWVLTPGIAAAVASMAFYFLGDWLRDLADPGIREIDP